MIKKIAIITIFLFTGVILIDSGGINTGKAGGNSGGASDTSDPSYSFIDTISGENYMFQSIDRMSVKQVYRLIDSLLDLKEIPVDLISEIKLYANSHYSSFVPDDYTFTDNSIYPASQYYKIWDTFNTHPYPETLSLYDTTVTLVLADSENKYVPPVVGKITSRFGYRDGRNHNGVDIDLQVWDTVVSAFNGKVRVARRHGGFGRLVVVRHNNGLETFYAHLQRIKVKAGQTVKAGELLGLGGKSGHATGSHLHFECRFKDKPLNPSSFISFSGNRLIRDTILLKKNRWNYTVIPKGVKYYTIQKGDCLYEIATKCGTTIQSLCALNSLSKKSILRPGRQIRIN